MEPYVGQIQLFAFNFAPQGWMACEGQMLPVPTSQDSPYYALFTLIGTTNGGDGVRTFALPDLRKTQPSPHVRYYIAVQGIYPSHDW